MTKLYDLARMTTATTGTGTITLVAAVDGCLTFADAGVTSGDVVSYGIEDSANGEVGTGTVTNTAGVWTLTRTVTKSTNGNAAISLSGTAEVFITPRAQDLADAGNLTSGTLDAARLSTYESSQTTFSSGGSGSFTHGLGAVPRFIEPVLVCQSNSAGWIAGDEVHIGGVTTGNRGLVITANSTTIKWQVGSTGIDMMTTPSGATGVASTSDFKFKVYARL